MATYTLSPSPWQTFFYANGDPVAAGQLFTYQAGTTTPSPTYLTSSGTANTNPIILDAAGRATIYLAPGSSYRFDLFDSVANGGALIKSQDNISAIPATASETAIDGIAGETLTAGNVVYLSDGSGGLTAGRWYKAKADNAYSSTTPEVGFVTADIATGATGGILLVGRVTVGLTVTVGFRYYISSGTAGALTSTAPALARYMGEADSGTSLVSGRPFIPQLPTVNGQIPIGNGTSFTNANLTAGVGLTITNGAGSITITPSVTMLSNSTTEQIVANTTTPTSIFSFSVPGGTLGTSKMLRYSQTGYYNNTSGGASTLAFVGVYGATTFVTGSFRNFTTGSTGAIRMTIELSANGATNSQRVVISIQHITDAVGEAAGALAGATTVIGFFDTMAEDSTAAKTFSVSVTHGTANALISLKAWERLLELVG